MKKFLLCILIFSHLIAMENDYVNENKAKQKELPENINNIIINKSPDINSRLALQPHKIKFEDLICKGTLHDLQQNMQLLNDIHYHDLDELLIIIEARKKALLLMHSAIQHEEDEEGIIMMMDNEMLQKQIDLISAIYEKLPIEKFNQYLTDEKIKLDTIKKAIQEHKSHYLEEWSMAHNPDDPNSPILTLKIMKNTSPETPKNPSPPKNLKAAKKFSNNEEPQRM